MKWKGLQINSNLIKARTEKYVLINMPHNSEYDGYAFWHPAKLVWDGLNSAAPSIRYTDGFVFRLKKYGKGRYNSREVLDEIPLAPDEMEIVFAAIGDNIIAPEPEPLIHIPEHLEPENAKADESLIDYEQEPARSV